MSTYLKKYLPLSFGLMLGILVSFPAAAHVVVKPNQVGVGTFQTFTVGVPVEKDMPTIGVRLVIPDTLKHVSPNVKPGWNIEVKKTGEGEHATVTEIIWTGGVIPPGQRDDFLFSAQAPAQQTTLARKAYQTYQDGSVVAWDQNQNSTTGHTENMTPYSETAVMNDLKSNPTTPATHVEKDNKPLVISGLALALSIISLGLQFRKK